jgi:hypothetical protein
MSTVFGGRFVILRVPQKSVRASVLMRLHWPLRLCYDRRRKHKGKAKKLLGLGKGDLFSLMLRCISDCAARPSKNWGFDGLAVLLDVVTVTDEILLF